MITELGRHFHLLRLDRRDETGRGTGDLARCRQWIDAIIDTLKGHADPHRAAWRPRVGLKPQISDAEMATLCVMQALLSFTSEARWLRHARKSLRHLFPYLPKQPGYNKRLRKLTHTVNWLIRQLAMDTSLWSDDVWVVDSTPIECARSRDTVRGCDLAGWAEYGYCASHSRYFWGLRLHLVATLHGLPIAFALTGTKADERQVLLDLLGADPDLVASHAGQTLIADKNYYCGDFEADLAVTWPVPGCDCCARPARANPRATINGSSSPSARPSSRYLGRHGAHTPPAS